MNVRIARVYGLSPGLKEGVVLVDRLWPRGLARHQAPFDLWLKDVAPSSELRRWYGHVPERFEEFATRYRQELTQGAAHDALIQLRALADDGDTILVTATKDLDRSGAAVLREILLAGS